MKVQRPDLAKRATRIRLLAWYRNVVIDGAADGARGGKPDSRMLAHDPLWYEGSWAELERAIERSDRYQRIRFMSEHVSARDPFASREWRSLVHVGMLMPRTIYVPPVVSKAAGYLASDAGRWAMPDGEARRRRAVVARVRIERSAA